VNVRLPDEIISMLDRLVARGIFSSRSEAIREFARAYVLEETKARPSAAHGGRHG
jgi:Arc/MetJ-type ribon-helix-helix transcriptional regulator